MSLDAIYILILVIILSFHSNAFDSFFLYIMDNIHMSGRYFILLIAIVELVKLEYHLESCLDH